MKRLLAVLLIVLVLLSGCVKETSMAVEFDGSEDQGISFGALSGLPALQGLSEKTVVYVVTVDTIPGGADTAHVFQSDTINADDESWSTGAHIVTSGDVWFSQVFDTTTGIWHSTAAVFVGGNTYVVIITYDKTNVANDPVFYVDNVSKPITEVQTPVGTSGSNTDAVQHLGAKDTATNKPIDGKVHLFKVYDRIVSAQEREAITNNRGYNDGVEEGLVFMVLGRGSATQQTYDGHVLVAEDVIVDEINGYVGVPHNSPIGYADDYLHIR